MLNWASHHPSNCDVRNGPRVPEKGHCRGGVGRGGSGSKGGGDGNGGCGGSSSGWRGCVGEDGGGSTLRVSPARGLVLDNMRKDELYDLYV